MREFIGWDIGGVHLKAARLSFRDGRLAEARTAMRYFEMWRTADRLPAALRDMSRDLGARDASHAVAMTAELADCFPSKPKGVLAIVAATREALGREPLRLWSTHATFASAQEAAREPEAFAASNWLATAEVAARCTGEGVLVDIGSTTTDIVPLVSGRPRPRSRDDTGRLTMGELVYTGALRTPPAAVSSEVPLRGTWCRLSSELFATMADVYLALGRLSSKQITVPTADNGPVTLEGARARLARLVCADPSDIEADQLRQMALHLESAQIRQIEQAARQVLSWGTFTREPVLIGTGVGKFLVPHLAARLGLPCRDLSELIPLSDPQLAPATCVALLLAEEALGERGPEMWKLRE